MTAQQITLFKHKTQIPRSKTITKPKIQKFKTPESLRLEEFYVTIVVSNQGYRCFSTGNLYSNVTARATEAAAQR